MANKTVYKRTKDDPIRSLLKAISWRVIASGTTFIISYFIFSNYSEQSRSEAMETASYITAIELVAKLLIYYLHERLWTNINWGKNWRARARQKIQKKQEKLERQAS
jgi:uncharacterized membrane protein